MTKGKNLVFQGVVSMLQASVASGATVTLSGVSVNYIWKNLTNSEPIPGKFDTGEVDVAGFENPMIRLSGLIDVNTDSTTAGYIKAFAKIKFDGTSSGNGGAIKLIVGAGSTPEYLKGASDSNDYIWVVIKNFNITFNTSDSSDGQKWSWNMDVVETTVDA